MSEELTKEEKIEKAKELVEEIKELELNDEELNQISAGILVFSQKKDWRTYSSSSSDPNDEK